VQLTSPREKLGTGALRYVETNRLLDPAYIASIGSFPRKTYDAIKTRKDIDSYEAISTDVGFGEKARVIERHGEL
jgi:hypothetical protein